MSILADIQGYTPGTKLELYIIDFTTTGLPTPPATMFLYSGVKANYGDVVFGGNTYLPFPMKIEGLKQSAEGPLPRPTVIISNINGFMSQQMTLYNDFIGAKVTRQQTFAKYLDGEAQEDPTAKVSEVYFVEQKKSENATLVELVLASAIDIMDAKLPSRIMLTNTCMWQYKGEGCSWPGTDSNYYFDSDDNPVVSQDDDVCGKRLTSCKYRFNHWNGSSYTAPIVAIPFAGFPALGRNK